RIHTKQYVNSKTKINLLIVTANPEIVDYTTNNEIYRNLINGANYVVPDGTGIVMASKLLKTPLKERVPGIEVMEECLKIANANYQNVFLLGDRKSTRLNSSHVSISYAVFCL